MSASALRAVRVAILHPMDAFGRLYAPEWSTGEPIAPKPLRISPHPCTVPLTPKQRGAARARLPGFHRFRAWPTGPSLRYWAAQRATFSPGRPSRAALGLFRPGRGGVSRSRKTVRVPPLSHVCTFTRTQGAAERSRPSVSGRLLRLMAAARESNARQSFRLPHRKMHNAIPAAINAAVSAIRQRLAVLILFSRSLSCPKLPGAGAYVRRCLGLSLRCLFGCLAIAMFLSVIVDEDGGPAGDLPAAACSPPRLLRHRSLSRGASGSIVGRGGRRALHETGMDGLDAPVREPSRGQRLFSFQQGKDTDASHCVIGTVRCERREALLPAPRAPTRWGRGL